MNNINDDLQPSSSIITNNSIDGNHTNGNENNNDEDTNLVIAKQLFEAYCKYPIYTATDEMASILLLLLLSLSPIQQTHQLSITSTTTSTSHSTTPTSHSISTLSTISISSITMQSIIASFIELRSEYIGVIDTTTNNNNNNTNNNQNTIPNRFSTNDDVFNYSLFHAALLTNSPMIIDAIMPYINYDFTTLNIPNDQIIDCIEQMTLIDNTAGDEIYPRNYIVKAIVDATKKGHYQSILHLINNYQLSPTIPICDGMCYKSYGCTNLLYYSRYNKNPQLIEYLLPLCFKSTHQQILTESILNIARCGHLHLIKQIHNEYNINLSQLQDQYYQRNILYYAVQSNNIELIDYLIEDIGLSVNERGILQSAIEAHKWDNVKHLITKHHADIQLARKVLNHAARDRNITPDMIDYIITTFNVPQNEINDTTPYNSPLHSFARNCNVIALKHIIEKYNVNPHCLFREHDGKGDSLLHITLHFLYKIKSTQLLEMVTYLVCELGLDVNKIGNRDRTPIEILVRNQSQSNECRLPIFKLLLDHKAEIGDVDDFIECAVYSKHFSIIKYLIETHQPLIHVKNIKLVDQSPLLHYVIRNQPSIEFIQYLLSLNTIDINKPDCNGTTPILHAMTSSHFKIDVVQLLIQNGATVTINDWLIMFSQFAFHRNPYKFFQLLDYFNNTFGFNVETFSLHGQHNSLHRFRTTPLLQYSLKQLTFRYSTIKYDKNHFNAVLMYRTLIHHYKANVNDQDANNNNNTVFHNLATNNHYELIQFTLLHSHSKPNIYLVNNKGETFLHILVSKCDQWIVGKYDEGNRKDAQQSIFHVLDGIQQINEDDFQLIITDDEINDRYDNFEKVLDCTLDLIGIN